MKARYFSLLILFSSYSAMSSSVYAKDYIKVTGKPLADLLISSKSSAPATVVSLNHATLGAQIAGKIKRVRVEMGDRVKKNQTLIDIDCRDYVLIKKQAETALQSVQAQLVLAQKQYNRNLTLRKQKTIPQNSLDQALLQRQLSRADIIAKSIAIKQADLSIERCRIKAPFSGQITEKLVSKGQLLAPNSPVFKLLQTKAFEIEAELTSAEIINAGKVPTLSFTRGALRIPVKFRSVINEVNSASRTQRVRLVPDRVDGLVVGSSGRVEWESRRALLPADYLLRRNGALGVMLLEKNKEHEVIAKFHALPDANEGQPAFINLPGSTQIAITNRFRLTSDEVVELD